MTVACSSAVTRARRRFLENSEASRDLYPEICINLITSDEELDLATRGADVAIRLRRPTQPNLIQRKLFSMHFHAYASSEYLKRFGMPRSLKDLDGHRIMLLAETRRTISRTCIGSPRRAATARGRASRGS
jgi:DNA-binding transcriptional LysR family regulator